MLSCSVERRNQCGEGPEATDLSWVSPWGAGVESVLSRLGDVGNSSCFYHVSSIQKVGEGRRTGLNEPAPCSSDSAEGVLTSED